MADVAHTVPRTRGPGTAAVSAVLPAVLLALLIALLGPSVLGGEHAQVPGGTVLAAGAEPAHSPARPSGPYADDAEPGVSTAAVRSHRDATGERHAPPVLTPGASPGTAIGPRPPGQPLASAVDPPASEQPAHRHGGRAPPSLSGI